MPSRSPSRRRARSECSTLITPPYGWPETEGTEGDTGERASPREASATWRTLEHADGSGPALGLMRSESPVERHPRVHLDLLVDTAAEQEATIERLIGLGAARVDWDLYPPDPDFVVLADPDGNAFCVVDMSRQGSAAD